MGGYLPLADALMSFCDNSRLAGTASDFSKRSFGLALLRLDARKRDDCNVGEILGISLEFCF